MAAFDPQNLLNDLRIESIRVRIPTPVVFLCGGALSPEAASPTMLRDAFYRFEKDSETKYKIVLAEAAFPLSAEAGYGDLLQFEQDIAQVVGLIVLFVESAGSLAELGAFSALPTVAPRLLAILDEYHYEQRSFVKNGPITFLENKHGEEWVLSLERKFIGIDDDGNISALKPKEFLQSVKPVIEKRLTSIDTSNKLDVTFSGHAILLIVGLCQEFGALTITEIRECLLVVGFVDMRIKNYIYCAKLLGWIDIRRKGNNIYYVGIPDRPSIEYQLKAGPSDRDKLRWRSEIRQHWRETDGSRFRAITESLAARAINND